MPKNELKSFKRAAAVCALVAVVSGCATTQSIVPNRSSDEKAAAFNAELANNYLATGELEQAEVKLKRALRQDPRNALANNTYGKLRAELDDPAEADKYFRKSIQLDSKRAEYRNNYAIFLCDHGKTNAAIEQFVLASENKFYRNPERALDNAGVCALEANNLPLADNYLRQAIKINPEFSPSMLHMAELKLKSGDADVADAYYSRFLSLSRHSPRSLAVGIDIMQALGDQGQAHELARELVTRYPRSKQARVYLASN